MILGGEIHRGYGVGQGAGHGPVADALEQRGEILGVALA